jgi:hypothetical protein
MIDQLTPLIKPAAILLALVAIGLFFAYRQDYKSHPDRTVIAVKLTLSTLRKILSLGFWKTGEKPPVTLAAIAPIEDGVNRPARPTPTDMSTISRPIPAIRDPREEQP